MDKVLLGMMVLVIVAHTLPLGDWWSYYRYIWCFALLDYANVRIGIQVWDFCWLRWVSTIFANQTFGPNCTSINEWNMKLMDALHVATLDGTIGMVCLGWWGSYGKESLFVKFPVSTICSLANMSCTRTEFHLGISGTRDNSSFQVTMYVSIPYSTSSLDDVWVLRIPSFVGLKWRILQLWTNVRWSRSRS